MGKRGPKPRNAISAEWSANLAYAVGLIASDGCLYNDGRHMSLVSKDIDQIQNFNKCLGITLAPGKTVSGYDGGWAYRQQFSSVLFYNFLLSIGLTPAKSKTMGVLAVPDEYFFDFLRGSFDGDGCFHSYWDSRWRSSHMFYIEFISASKAHVDWIEHKITTLGGTVGHRLATKDKQMYKIRYAKKDTLEIIKKMYYSQDVVCLPRKKLKIEKALAIEREQQEKY